MSPSGGSLGHLSPKQGVCPGPILPLKHRTQWEVGNIYFWKANPEVIRRPYARLSKSWLDEEYPEPILYQNQPSRNVFARNSFRLAFLAGSPWNTVHDGLPDSGVIITPLRTPLFQS